MDSRHAIRFVFLAIAGGFSPAIARADETAAIAAIKKIGGGLEVDDTPSGNAVVGVYLLRQSSPDTVLMELQYFAQLRSLSLDESGVTDKGLVEVARLRRLTLLSLNDTRVSDLGLKMIRGLTQLRHLSLAQTRITDAGLSELASLEHLLSLNLRGVSITDNGLPVLARLKRLESLALNGTKIGDGALKYVALLKDPGLPRCQLLHKLYSRHQLRTTPHEVSL